MQMCMYTRMLPTVRTHFPTWSPPSMRSAADCCFTIMAVNSVSAYEVHVKVRSANTQQGTVTTCSWKDINADCQMVLRLHLNNISSLNYLSNDDVNSTTNE